MGLGKKITNILEYKISLDLDAGLDRKKAYKILGIVTAIVFIFVYIVGEAFFWGVDDRGVFERQIEVLETTSENTDNPEVKADLALTYYLKGDTDKAQDLFEEVLEKDKDNALANIYYGLIIADQQQYRDAIPFLLRGIEKEPERENLAYIYLGISYYRLGGYDQAIKYLDAGTKLDPGSALGYYYLGLVYKKQGNNINARSALERALTLSGNNYPEAAKELKMLTGK